MWVRKDFNGFLVNTISCQVPDATCVTPKNIPLGLDEGSVEGMGILNNVRERSCSWLANVGSVKKINSKLIRAQHEKKKNQAGITASNINCGPPGPLGEISNSART